MKGYMYILRCANNTLYIGSTNDLESRINQHQNGDGSNFSWKYLPVELVYHEEFDRIDEAFKREKQIQKWSRQKKEALIQGDIERLKRLAKNHSDNRKGVKKGEV
ncbi:MAG: GIY-YIG nuclease family protein [Bacteroidota bacterium]|nr:GIY-YIG nuclease family protein [Bacteroidota bacterium]